MYEQEFSWGIEVFFCHYRWLLQTFRNWRYIPGTTLQGCSGDRTGWNGWRCPMKTDATGETTYMAILTILTLCCCQMLKDQFHIVSLQILCLRNLWQNVSTILDHDILPTFPTSRRAIPCHVLASKKVHLLVCPASP